MPSRWRERSLGELIALQRGYDLPEKDRKPGTIPVCGSAGINGYHNEARASGPGVTIGRSGASMGVVNYYSQDFWPHNTVLFVTDFKGNDPRFIAYLLSRLPLADLNSGAAQPSLNRNFVYGLKTGVPDVRRQRRIAEILAAYDDLIENNTRRIAILEEMARRLFDSNAGGCASSGTRLLGELVFEVRDPVDPSLLPSATPYVGLEHLPRRSTTLREWGRVEEVASLKLRFLPNDILFGKIRPYFHKVAIAPITGVCSSDAIVLRCRRAEDRAFVLSCVSSDPFIAHAVQTSNGTKMPRANWTVLQNWPVPKLTEAELRRFSAAVEPRIDLCCVLAAQNRRLRAARDLLLPKLISGEIEVGAAPIPEAAAAE